jgi:hypothetical protein
MKTFLQWAEENNLGDLASVEPASDPATSENTKRTGYSANYPDAYVRSQYPDGYFPPVKATAFLDKTAKAKTPADNTP